MKKIWILVLCCGALVPCVAQEKQKKVRIQYLPIADSSIIGTIRQVIDQEVNSSDTNHFFRKGLGYVAMHIQRFSGGDTVLRYDLLPAMYGFKKKDDDDVYPPFYSYVDGRLVLIFSSQLERVGGKIAFTTKSKARLRKQVDRFLEKTERAVFRDMNNKKVFTDRHFRMDYIQFDNETTVFLLRNGKAIVKKGR